MRKLDSSKSKNLQFSVKVEDTSMKEVDFFYRVIIEGIEYGFKGKPGNGNVSFQIPALESLIKGSDNKKTYAARLDTVAEGKHFDTPYTEKISIKKNPKVNIKESEEIVNESIEEPVAKTIVVGVKEVVTEDCGKPHKKKKKKLIKKSKVTEADDNILKELDDIITRFE